MTTSSLMTQILSFRTDKVDRIVVKNGDNMAHNIKEQRKHKRIRSNDRLFAQIVACEKQPELVGSTISCLATDLSASGIRIKSYEYIPEGSQLDLWIDVNSRPGKFFLTSKVKWVQEDGGMSYSYRMGVELDEGAATDFEEWMHIHS